MPKLEEWEIKKYWEIFSGLGPVDNKLTGDRVQSVLKNSRLPDAQLAQIWELLDIDEDGRLDFEEFCITMRLIFDLVNGNAQSVPSQLPDWLIPSSKLHLLQAKRALTGQQDFLTPPSSTDDDDDRLLDDFDWYISPTDRSTYELIYNRNSDTLGRVKFELLRPLYDELSKVPASDISSAWNLVNPKLFETIDKDQVLVFLHILNQRENGKRVPRGVPASLRATFSKEAPNYNLAAQQPTKQPPAKPVKKAFGQGYLEKIGQGSAVSEKGTDFSVTEGTDWEEVRLKRELADLESLLEKAQAGSATASENDQQAVTKHQFEQLLKYKQSKVHEARLGVRGDLKGVTNDIDLIESQVQQLEQYLTNQQNELAKVNQEIAMLK